jgi:hypothetical protein
MVQSIRPQIFPLQCHTFWLISRRFLILLHAAVRLVVECITDGLAKRKVVMQSQTVLGAETSGLKPYLFMVHAALFLGRLVVLANHAQHLGICSMVPIARPNNRHLEGARPVKCEYGFAGRFAWTVDVDAINLLVLM